MLLGRSIPATFAAVLAAGATLLLPASALASPPNPLPYGDFTCTDGRTLAFSGVMLPQFPQQQFPLHVAFIDGKGAVAFWMDFTVSGTLTVIDGAGAGQVLTIQSHPFAGPMNTHRQAPVELSRLMDCTLSEGESSPAEGVILTPELARDFDLADRYVGALVTYDVTFRQTVWVKPNQLSKR